MRATATPKLDRTMRLRDGRQIGYAEWGDLTGRPVVLLHGDPGSRLFCPDEDATAAAGVRLITIDRSGYGRSDPRTGPRVLDWVADFVELTGQLGLPACPVVGWSRGGAYALACAFGAPDRVPVIGLAASVAPLRFIPEVEAPISRGRIQQLVSDRPAAIHAIIEECHWYVDDPDAWSADMTDPTDPDARLISRPEIREPMNVWFREGARRGSAGMVGDQIADLDPWGFSLGDIRQTVHVWWADADRLVTRRYTDYLATNIPHSVLTVYPGEGHLFPINHWGEMLAALA
jgi:pimeloyl-ACP methyl ester carboxylesterase